MENGYLSGFNTQRPDIQTVLGRYYSGHDLGENGDSLNPIRGLIEDAGLHVHEDSIAALRGTDYRASTNLGETLLLAALRQHDDWKTVTVGIIMKDVVSLLQGIVEEDADGRRKSTGLTDELAAKLGLERYDITSILAGIRLDGALIAVQEECAWKRLSEARHLMLCTYEKRPPSQQRPDFQEAFGRAGTPQELYRTLYAAPVGENAGRRIGAFVPYELEYWRWLLESDAIQSMRHLPFTQAVIESYCLSPSYVHERLAEELSPYGIPYNKKTGSMRMRFIRSDFPKL